MRRLWIALVFLVVCAPHAQAWTLIDKAACPDNNSGNGVTAGCSINSGGGDILIVTFGIFAGTPMLSDSKSNTWTCKTLVGVTAYKTRICYAAAGVGAISVGASHTITIAATSSFIGATFSAWSGSKTSADPFDGEATNASTAMPVTSGSVGALAPTGGANDLFVTTGMGHGTTEFDAATVTSFTLIARQTYSGGVSIGNQAWYLASTSSTTAAWAWSGSTDFSLDMLAFLPGAAPPPTTPCTFSLLGVGKC